MARKILFTALVFIALGLIGTMVPGMLSSAPVGNVGAQEIRPGEQRIREATVLITMTGPEQPLPVPTSDQSTTYQMFRGRGVGTLITVAGESLIITHDHWSLLDAELDQVHFYSADNAPLATVSGDVFRGLVQYRDGGTLILRAPAAMASSDGYVTPYEDPGSVSPGATVEVVHRAGPESGVAIMAAVVEAIEMKGGVATFSLRSLDGQTIVPGDSGGGIWFGGQLVGNLWTTVNEQVTVTKNWFWGSRTTDEVENSRSKAAVLTSDLLELMSVLLEGGLPAAATANGPS